MGSLLHDLTGVEHDHQIRRLGGGQTVCDRDRGTALREGGQRVAEVALGLGVDVGGRLVEYQQARVGQLCPCQGDQLALADRQGVAALAHLGVDAV